jgi:hypothetical protein
LYVKGHTTKGFEKNINIIKIIDRLAILATKNPLKKGFNI